MTFLHDDDEWEAPLPDENPPPPEPADDSLKDKVDAQRPRGPMDFRGRKK